MRVVWLRNRELVSSVKYRKSVSNQQKCGITVQTQPIFRLSRCHPYVFRWSSAGDLCCSAAGGGHRNAQPSWLKGIHMAVESTEEKHIQVELTVLETQREELQLAWHEIVAGKRPRMNALDHEVSAIAERAMDALRIIEDAIRRNPTTGQARRLIWFLAAVYSGPEYLFDLTELRALDCELASSCLDYLNYDRLGRREVHRHLSSGDDQLHQWIGDYGLRAHGTPTD